MTADPSGTPACTDGGSRLLWAGTELGVSCDRCDTLVTWDAFNHWWALRVLEDLGYLVSRWTRAARMTTVAKQYARHKKHPHPHPRP